MTSFLLGKAADVRSYPRLAAGNDVEQRFVAHVRSLARSLALSLPAAEVQFAGVDSRATDGREGGKEPGFGLK